MITYVVDDAALIAGLDGGSESQRRELSRVLHGCFDGGPPVLIPALCLTAAATIRPAIADHTAMLVVQAAPGAMAIDGLAGGRLHEVVAEFPWLGFAGAHAVSSALLANAIIVTADVDRYGEAPVDAMAL